MISKYTVIILGYLLLAIDALARSFNPGPIFAMGQKIPHKNHKSIQFKYISYGSQRKPVKIGYTQFLYGITNRWSWNINVPIISIQDNNKKSAGLADIILESEYAFLKKEEKDFLHQMTALGAVYFPSATTSIQSVFASKSYNFLFGVTHSLRSSAWHVYTEALYLFTTKQKNNFKLENIFFYNLGCGKVIYKNGLDDLSIYIEMSNLISQAKNDPNAINLPGTLVLLGPSFRCNFYNGRFSFKVGVQYAIADNGKKYEEHIDYRIGSSLRIYF